MLNIIIIKDRQVNRKNILELLSYGNKPFKKR